MNIFYRIKKFIYHFVRNYIGIIAVCEDQDIRYVKDVLKEEQSGCIPCHKYRFVYFPIAKVASTTIKNFIFFEDYGLRNVITHKSRIPIVKYHLFQYSVENLQRTKASKYISFVVVRDPVERLISCYSHRFLELGEFANIPNKNLDTFLDYVEKHLKFPIANQNVHLRSQSSYFSHKYVDYVVTLDSLSKFFIEKFGVSLKKENIKRKKTTAVSEEQCSRIREMYKSDISIKINYS